MIKSNAILRSVIFIILSLTASFGIAQEIKLEIEAPKKIRFGETFRAKYIVSGAHLMPEDIETLNIGTIKNFELLDQPIYSKSEIIRIEGKVEKKINTIAEIYTMQAVKIGKQTLPEAEVVINGKKYKSPAHKIEVVPQPLNGKGDIFDEEIDGDDEFVRTIISRNRVGTNDTLLLTYRLYTKFEVGDIVDANYPSLNKDFYTQDITPHYVLFGTDFIGNTEYNTVDIRTVILQPKEEGLKKIQVGDIEIEFIIPTGEKVKTYKGEVEVLKKERKKLFLDGAVIEVLNLVDI